MGHVVPGKHDVAWVGGGYGCRVQMGVEAGGKRDGAVQVSVNALQTFNSLVLSPGSTDIGVSHHAR